MQIVCATTAATHRSWASCLQPVQDFEIRPILSIVPPITYSMLVVLTAAQVTKIGTIADTTIGE